MKIFRIILLTLCVLVTLFFVVYANIQAKFADEQATKAATLAEHAIALQGQAEKEAANAREAEARAALYKLELEKCQDSKQK